MHQRREQQHTINPPIKKLAGQKKKMRAIFFGADFVARFCPHNPVSHNKTTLSSLSQEANHAARILYLIGARQQPARPAAPAGSSPTTTRICDSAHYVTAQNPPSIKAISRSRRRAITKSARRVLQFLMTIIYNE